MKRFKDFISEASYSKDEEIYQVDVLERNDEIINKIIDKFSFRYKKIKDRYLRPDKITGKTLYKDTDLQIFLTNKDVIRIIYNDLKETDELKIYINDDLIYHLDYIEDMDIVDKASELYQKSLEKQKYKVLKKSNPFE